MHRKKKILITTAAVLAIGAGSAFAYWSTTGSGSGTGTTANSNGTITLHASFDTGITPGGTREVTFTADNPGSSSLRVGTVTSVVSASGTCDATWFSLPAVVQNQTIAPATTGVALANKGTLTFSDSADNQDACKGATLTLALTSN
ncbi:hypothetical protein [Kribbella sp. NPDC050459]|uniref:hypothetical protein n=1 Tax=Kribbella sp. NPDC050459 TaxID=3155785 RepID=UPI0033DACD89